MRYSSPADQLNELEKWPEASAKKLIKFAEFQEPFDQFERVTGITVWSGKTGRLAWPLSFLIIIALSIGLWAGIIFLVRSLIM